MELNPPSKEKTEKGAPVEPEVGEREQISTDV